MNNPKYVAATECCVNPENDEHYLAKWSSDGPQRMTEEEFAQAAAELNQFKEIARNLQIDPGLGFDIHQALGMDDSDGDLLGGVNRAMSRMAELENLVGWAQHHVSRSALSCDEFLDRAMNVLGPVRSMEFDSVTIRR